MARVRYTPDRAGVGLLMRSAEMAAMVRSAAHKGAIYAASIAPRDTGTYARSFRVEVNRIGGSHADRAEAVLVNEAPYAWAVEFVNGDRVLGRTVDFIEAAGP